MPLPAVEQHYCPFMFADERRKTILDLVQSTGAIAIKELARAVDTSEVTIRRDLRALEADGLLDRRHGGAVASGGFSREATYLQKSHVAAEEKAAIGALAATLVDAGDAIAIGAGSTTQALARCLVRCHDLTVITNSLLVAQALAGARGVDVILTGGNLRGSILALVGSAAERSLVGVRTNKVFLSGNGLTPERGLSTPNSAVAAMDKAMLATAEEAVVLADDSKLGLEKMVQTIPVALIEHLVINAAADPEQVDAFREAGVAVHLATVGHQSVDQSGAPLAAADL